MELDKLDKVALLARSRESEAASGLHRSQQAFNQSSAKLSQLEQFKHEYEQRLAALASEGMDARQLADYRRFLGKLSSAISQQDQEVSRSGSELASSRDTLVDRSVKRSSVDELINRGRAELALRDSKREQRAADESSLRRHTQD